MGCGIEQRGMPSLPLHLFPFPIKKKNVRGDHVSMPALSNRNIMEDINM